MCGACHNFPIIGQVSYRLTIDLANDVARLEAGFVSRTVRSDSGDYHAVGCPVMREPYSVAESTPDVPSDELKAWRALLIALSGRLSAAHLALIEQYEAGYRTSGVVDLLNVWGMTHHAGECACYVTSDVELEAAAAQPDREDTGLVAWVMAM